MDSGDEVDDVIPDAKVRIYPKVKPVPVVVPIMPVGGSQPVIAPAVNAPLADLGNLVTKNTILNLSKLTIPIVPAETKLKMRLNCPQIRKTVIELPFD